MQKLHSFQKFHHRESISCVLSSIAISKVSGIIFEQSCPSQGVLKEVAANIYELQEGAVSLRLKTVLYDLAPVPLKCLYLSMYYNPLQISTDGLRHHGSLTFTQVMFRLDHFHGQWQQTSLQESAPAEDRIIQSGENFRSLPLEASLKIEFGHDHAICKDYMCVQKEKVKILKAMELSNSHCHSLPRSIL